MPERYILGIDQSTSGTKALLFNRKGALIGRADRPHRQIVDARGWVEHDPVEIYQNLLQAVKTVVGQTGIDRNAILGVGISNQRETAVVWDRESGKPIYRAIVWQCGRGKAICDALEARGAAGMIQKTTGLRLSPYFSAAKFAWILQNVPGIRPERVCCGTMDSWLIYCLTGGKHFLSDYSNASRTQLFDLRSLTWSDEVGRLFGIVPSMLAEVLPSDASFGTTTFEGFLERPVPIHSVLGDSHGALFGQGCHRPGNVKATYGTGSSVMMNVGDRPVFSDNGLVTSIGWMLDGKVTYVLEGNINYAGAVMKWLAEDLGLMDSPQDACRLACMANPADGTYLVPAFSGLGAPYWDDGARAILCGMTRTTGKAEIIRAANECIAYQIADVVDLMQQAAGIPIASLRADGGPTRNPFLMQFQSDVLRQSVDVTDVEEISGLGAAYAAGCALGLYDRKEVFSNLSRTAYCPNMEEEQRRKKKNGWAQAVKKARSDGMDG